jgi:hypothetical protein
MLQKHLQSLDCLLYEEHSTLCTQLLLLRTLEEVAVDLEAAEEEGTEAVGSVMDSGEAVGGSQEGWEVD